MTQIQVRLDILQDEQGKYYGVCQIGETHLDGKERVFDSREECREFYNVFIPKMLSDVGVTDLKKTHAHGKPVQ